MDRATSDDRPAKKRRFFVDESSPLTERFRRCSPTPERTTEPTPEPKSPGILDKTINETLEQSSYDLKGFDVALFESVVGDTVPEWILRRLKFLSKNDVQRAINLYLDGSWKEDWIPMAGTEADKNLFPQTTIKTESKINITDIPKLPKQTSLETVMAQDNCYSHTPNKRYIGAFGVVGWATKSGAGLLKHEEKVGIERVKMQAPTAKLGRGGKARLANRKSQDLLVRFTNRRGDEVGRLEHDSAAWISSLIDQKICSFEGFCVYAPDRLRTSDTVYLQLHCYILKSAFEKKTFAKVDSNRTTTLFAAKESEEEKDLRLRQVALVKLFDAINLNPSRVNETTEKHKRQGLLQAAEIAEQYEQKPKPKLGDSEDPNSTPDEAEEGQELEQDQLDTLYKKAQTFDFNTPEMEPAETFCLDLRKYQKQALHWMIGKERNEVQEKEVSMHPLWEEYRWPVKDVDGVKLPEVENQEMFYVNPYSGELSLEFPKQEQNCLGGVLADEMGLGKTIEMLSLMHTNRIKPSTMDTGSVTVNDLPKLQMNSSAVEKAPYTTLVVAPMSLLAQWQSEAEKASKEGTLKTMVYYGSEKAVNLQKLCCESNAANAPNLIITSYGVILSEFNQVANQEGNRGSHGGLFSLDYFRVILDEAHYIKNRQSKTAKACYEISAKHRWVLTGTPIVNRLEDLFSLVRFLKVEPWSNFSFWKTFITVPFESKDFIRALDVVQTVLEPLVLRRTKDMKTPEGEQLVPLPPRTIEIEKIELSQDERDVYDHIFLRAKRVFDKNAEAGTLLKSYTTIFAQILRLRQSCCHPVLTRNKTIVVDEEDASLASDLATGLGDDMDLQALIARFTSETDTDVNSKYGAHILSQIQEEAESECPICSEEPMVDQAVTGCWHSACKQCLLDYIQHQRDKNIQPRCFSCRAPINARDVFEVIRHDALPSVDENIRSDAHITSSPPASTKTADISLRRIGLSGSAKTAALLTHLKSLRREDPAAKSVVFSQFTAFLDLIEPALTRDRIPFLRFDGTISQKARAAVLSEFASSPKPYVLLLSLRAGGVGLNLTCARRVFMMDPWWSFAVEAQAIDRVHRMGQTDAVRVTRFVVKASIEEKMLRIQERKKFIASSLGMMSDEEKRVQRIEDIKELLS